ncbi:hypothetical protein BJY00DRAFT_306869 [Aspergillus carlsbadensis]|nr:hypothetical protein BJY00DRAFT_306869 [Aspergillus carlsbadensis]
MIPGRRSHRKSKAGCLQCKARKVKCDEEKPACRKCNVHGVTCSFTPRPNTSSQPAQRPPTSSTSSPVGSSSPPESTPPGLTPSPISDLELLHHYTTSTCYTLSRVPAIQAVWRDQAPRIGFSPRFGFVLHAILAISALHKAHTSSDQGYRATCMLQARTHHNSAIRAVVPALTCPASTDTENSAALFLFSTLTCIFSCAISGQDTDKEKDPDAGADADPDAETEPATKAGTETRAHKTTDFHILFEQGHLSQWLQLFRGTKAVLDSSGSEIHQGCLGPIFMNGTYLSAARREAQTFEQGTMYVWELKQAIIHEHAANESLLAIYLRELDCLARTLGVALKPGERLETGDVFAWLLEVSDEYLELLRRGEPFALVLFAYFCVCVRRVEWLWWTEGLSWRLMGQVHAALDGEYRCWLLWPQRQIGWVPTCSV